MRFAISVVVLLSLSSFSFAKEEHDPRGTTPNRGVAPTVQLCTIEKVNTKNAKKVIDKKPVICEGQNKNAGKKVELSAKLIERLKGKTFLTGDPCHPPKTDEPPPPPSANLAGFKELIAEACAFELGLTQIGLAGEYALTDDVKVKMPVLEELDYANTFTPYGCSPKLIHN